MLINEQILRKLIRKILQEEADILSAERNRMQTFMKNYGKKLSQNNICKWEYNKSKGIKVFFDVEGFWGSNQDFIGRLIIAGNFLSNFFNKKTRHLATSAATHTGFIFSDGVVFHATPDRIGVQFDRSYIKKIKEKPENFLILDLGGNEDELIKLAHIILDEIKENKEFLKNKYGSSYKELSSYDNKGILRNIPGYKWLISKIIDAREKHDYSYYCSELIAYCLIKLGIINQNDVNVDIDSYEADEVSPTMLYEKLRRKGDILLAICGPDAEEIKKNIYHSV